MTTPTPDPDTEKDEDEAVVPETRFLNNIFGGSAWGGRPGTFGSNPPSPTDDETPGDRDGSIFAQIFG